MQANESEHSPQSLVVKLQGSVQSTAETGVFVLRTATVVNKLQEQVVDIDSFI